MNNSFQLKYRVLVFFLLIILEMCSSVSLECAVCVCLFFYFFFFFLRKLWVWEKNPLTICKPVRNEEPTMRPWERHWNRVTHGETERVERSVCVTVGDDNSAVVLCHYFALKEQFLWYKYINFLHLFFFFCFLFYSFICHPKINK